MTTYKEMGYNSYTYMYVYIYIQNEAKQTYIEMISDSECPRLIRKVV